MLALLAVIALTAQTDPLAPARDGLVQCYDPAPAGKLCRAIGAYEFLPDGSIISDGMNRIENDLPVVLFARSRIEVRDGKICSIGPITAADIHRVDVAGQSLDGPALAQARAQIYGALPSAMRSGSLCSAYTANPDGSLTTTVDIDGVHQSDMGSTVRWVRPGDGWTVIP